jgi:hypothetical protein
VPRDDVPGGMVRPSGVLAALKPGRKSITPRVPSFPAKEKTDAHLPRAKFEAAPISAPPEAAPISTPLIPQRLVARVAQAVS